MRSQDGPSILVAQIGARRHYAVPVILQRAGLLGAVATDLTNSGFIRVWARFLSSVGLNAAKRLADRLIPEIPDEKIISYPLFGLSRVVRRWLISDPGTLRRHHALSNAKFGELVANLDLRKYDAVYVFNGAGLEIARIAKEKGLKVILDQTAAPVREEERLLREEREKWKGWEEEPRDQTSWELLAEREEAEWELADLIVCGSDYVRNCLIDAGVSASRIRVVPPGVPQLNNVACGSAARDRKFIVLFAGTLCLRKGVPYLAEVATHMAREVNFRAVGTNGLSPHGLEQLTRHVTYGGTIPRSQMIQVYQQADVFILPSLSEGSANVCYEAMAAGLPVITTPNAGSVVRDGVEGFIVPIRCSESLSQAIEAIIGNSELLESMRELAIQRAAEFTWAKYEERLVLEIRRLLS
jgi:glycosyltransferase involved in cell wall biosynthesis